MSQLFAAFGLDWHLLLINLLNFGLLLFVLWYFLYEPLTKVLENRRQKMIEGVHDANAAKERLEEIERSRAELLAAAGREADDVLAAARAAALVKERELVAASETSAAAVLREAEAQAEELKREALEQSKQEVAKLIVLGMEKVAAK